MTRLGLLLPLGLLVASGLWGQQFEVASIRLSGPQSLRGSDGGPGSRDPERYTFGQVTLLDLICTAYNVQRFQIDSKMALDRDAFDLAAKMPADTTKEQFRKMLQNLLAERFRLKLRIESREFPAYELVVGKSGAKLTESKAGTPFRNAPSPDGFPKLEAGKAGMSMTNSFSGGYPLQRLIAQREPLSVLLMMMKAPDARPIADHTGLTGTYDFTLEFSSVVAPVEGLPPAPDLITAVHEQLGLDLVGKKLPFEVLVVESVDRTPTEN